MTTRKPHDDELSRLRVLSRTSAITAVGALGGLATGIIAEGIGVYGGTAIAPLATTIAGVAGGVAFGLLTAKDYAKPIEIEAEISKPKRKPTPPTPAFGAFSGRYAVKGAKAKSAPRRPELGDIQRAKPKAAQKADPKAAPKVKPKAISRTTK